MSKGFESISCFLCILFYAKSTCSDKSPAFVDVGGKRTPILLTWKSTGSCPPLPRDKVCEWISSQSFVHNLALISALPNDGIEFIRVHWLLSAIRVVGFSDSGVMYNFTCLDGFFKRLIRLNISVIFEIMGNPSNLFEDFENKTQVYLWRDFVSLLVSRYSKMFGLGYIKRWIFETWNEPKPINFESIKMTPQGFLNYYDSTAEGLKRVNPDLKLAAPGGGCKARYNPNNYCWLLLRHVQFGNSIFGGGRVIIPDFISIHVKGVFPNSSDKIVAGEAAFRQELDSHLPLFKMTEIINDEADPQVSWNVSRAWQADSSYAVVVVKTIESHLCSSLANNNNNNLVSLLSNDNAFLSYHPLPFTQRTLAARFQVNSTDPPHVQLVRKPVYAVLGLLSLLGDRLLGRCSFEDSFGWIATLHEKASKNQCWYLSIIMTRFQLDSRILENRSVHLHDLPVHHYPDMRYVTYYMDDSITNPYEVWMEAGSPQTPSDDVFVRMRQQEEPVLLHPPRDWTEESAGVVTVEMAPASVGLFQLCARTCGGPGRVIDVRGLNVTFNQLFIFWSDSEVGTKCLFTYEVEHSKNGRDYQRINPKPSVFNSFFHVGANSSDHLETVTGYYRVRAVDLWNDVGKYSIPYEYPS